MKQRCANPFEAIGSFFSKLTPQGRSSRADFWWVIFLVNIPGFILILISRDLNNIGQLLFKLITCAFVLWANYCLFSRRLHDIEWGDIRAKIWLGLQICAFVVSILDKCNPFGMWAGLGVIIGILNTVVFALILVAGFYRSIPEENEFGAVPYCVSYENSEDQDSFSYKVNDYVNEAEADDSIIKINCHHCGKELEVPATVEIGQHLLCPYCERKFSFGGVEICADNKDVPLLDKADLVSKIQKYNRDVRQKFKDKLMALEDEGFEMLVSKLLKLMGFREVSRIRLSRNNGFELLGTMIKVGSDVEQINMVFHVKRWVYNVQVADVQHFRDSLDEHVQGCIVTTSDFSSGARDEAVRIDKAQIALIDGTKLLNLMMEYQVGVWCKEVPLFEVCDNLLSDGE